MSWQMALFTYINLWCLSLFFVWPFTIETSDQQAVSGHEYGAAPRHIHWKRMMIGTSILAALVTVLIATIIYFVKQG